MAFVSRGGVVLRPGLSSHGGVPSRLSFCPSIRSAFRVSCVSSGRLVSSVSQGVSFHPIVIVASSVSPCLGPCLIEREHPCLVPPWVSGGVLPSLVLFSLTPFARSVPFSPAPFIVMVWRGLSRFPLRHGVAILAPLRSRHSLIVLRSPSYRIGFSPIGPFVGPFRLPGWVSRFPCRARASSASSGESVSFTWCFRSPLSARAVFPSSIFHLFPIVLVKGRRPSE